MGKINEVKNVNYKEQMKRLNSTDEIESIALEGLELLKLFNLESTLFKGYVEKQRNVHF